jgi:hypothetical protein
MKAIRISGIIMLLSLSGAAAAQDPAEGGAAAEAPVEQAAATPGKPKKVCRSEKVTGSLTRVRRTCLTVEEWAHIESRTRDEVGKLQRGAAGSTAVQDNAAAMAGAGMQPN